MAESTGLNLERVPKWVWVAGGAIVLVGVGLALFHNHAVVPANQSSGAQPQTIAQNLPSGFSNTSSASTVPGTYSPTTITSTRETYAPVSNATEANTTTTTTSSVYSPTSTESVSAGGSILSLPAGMVPWLKGLGTPSPQGNCATGNCNQHTSAPTVADTSGAPANVIPMFRGTARRAGHIAPQVSKMFGVGGELSREEAVTQG